MITLYSYPALFGLPDNNPFGLKVDAFLRLTKINYKFEHILDTQKAPRKQLPYIVDNDHLVSNSDTIIEYLTQKYQITLDNDLTLLEKNQHFLLIRMLDGHLYWVMSYSRWQDDQFWPLFKAAFQQQCPNISSEALDNARKYNIEKYYYQGIGRYDKQAVYQGGIDDLNAIKIILGNHDFIFGKKIHTIDTCCFGFLANIFYYEIETPLKAFITKEVKLRAYIDRLYQLLNYDKK